MNRPILILVFFLLFLGGPATFADDTIPEWVPSTIGPSEDLLVGVWDAEVFFGTTNESDFTEFYHETFRIYFGETGSGYYGLLRDDSCFGTYFYTWEELLPLDEYTVVYKMNTDPRPNFLHCDIRTNSFIFYINQDEEIYMQLYGLLKRLD